MARASDIAFPDDPDDPGPWPAEVSPPVPPAPVEQRFPRSVFKVTWPTAGRAACRLFTYGPAALQYAKRAQQRGRTGVRVERQVLDPNGWRPLP